ncbi:MAG: OsmC family protein [Bacteroidetes bacterium]|nr:OsmC family protein [Bacteroidota bacterium]
MLVCASKAEKYLCDATAGSHTISADAIIDKGGMGQAMRPHQILEAAYACCLNMTVRMVCDQLGIPHNRINVVVDLQRSEKCNLFTYSITFEGDLSDVDKNRIIKGAENCPVRRTLEKPFEFMEVLPNVHLTSKFS